MSQAASFFFFFKHSQKKNWIGNTAKRNLKEINLSAFYTPHDGYITPETGEEGEKLVDAVNKYHIHDIAS